MDRALAGGGALARGGALTDGGALAVGEHKLVVGH